MREPNLGFTVIPMDTGHKTIQEQFEEFHRRNPEVFALLERYTKQVYERGRGRTGIRMIWERMRWEVMMTTDDPNRDYKFNDHYTSRYVRLLVEVHPEWDHLFEKRRLRAR